MKKSQVQSHFDKVAEGYDKGKHKYSYYYSNLKKLLGETIPKGGKVLEFGCGTGDLLASLKPKSGYGMDISGEMVRLAENKYKDKKNLRFSTSWPKEKFDYVFMSDVIEHLENPREEFKKMSGLMDENSVLINTMANPLWEHLLMLWEKMGWKMKEGPHKRLVYKDIRPMMEKAGMKVIKHDYKLLVPIKIPLITIFLNKYLEKYFKRLCFIEYFVAVKI